MLAPGVILFSKEAVLEFDFEGGGHKQHTIIFLTFFDKYLPIVSKYRHRYNMRPIFYIIYTLYFPIYEMGKYVYLLGVLEQFDNRVFY